MSKRRGHQRCPAAKTRVARGTSAALGPLANPHEPQRGSGRNALREQPRPEFQDPNSHPVCGKPFPHVVRGPFHFCKRFQFEERCLQRKNAPRSAKNPQTTANTPSARALQCFCVAGSPFALRATFLRCGQSWSRWGNLLAIDRSCDPFVAAEINPYATTFEPIASASHWGTIFLPNRRSIWALRCIGARFTVSTWSPGDRYV